MMANAARSARPVVALARTTGEAQPRFGPSMSANTDRVSPSVTLTAPGRSSLRPGWAPGVGGDEGEGQQHGHARQRHVDEEHGFPAECSGEDAAEQDSDEEPRCAG